jgi:tetratricopeptide (TPR) repeat protein
MGMVYLAEDPDGNLVALKVIKEPFASDERFRERFLEEVRAMRRVARPYTARVLDAQSTASPPYLVTEYVEGPTLQYAIDRGGPWPYGYVKDLAMATALALEQVHAVGVVHRDFKPSNILLSLTGPKVIDFGIAAAADFAMGPESRLGFGTEQYMAPEQHEGEEGDRPADVFAWAATIVFASTGRPPDWIGPGRDLRDRVLHGRPRLDGVDPRLRPLVARALLQDPMERPVVEELLRELGVTTQDPEATRRIVEEITDRWTRPQHHTLRGAGLGVPTRPGDVDGGGPADDREMVLEERGESLSDLRARSASPLYLAAGACTVLAVVCAFLVFRAVVGILLCLVAICIVVAACLREPRKYVAELWSEYRAAAPYYRAMRLLREDRRKQAEAQLWELAYDGEGQWKRRAAIALGNLFQAERHATKAILAYQVGLEFADDPTGWSERALVTLARLNLGHAYQLAQRRPEAQEEYQRARLAAGRSPTGLAARYAEQATLHLRRLVERSDRHDRPTGRQPPPTPVPPPVRRYRPVAVTVTAAVLWALAALGALWDVSGDGVSYLTDYRFVWILVLFGAAVVFQCLATYAELRRLRGVVRGTPLAHVAAALFAVGFLVALVAGGKDIAH